MEIVTHTGRVLNFGNTKIKTVEFIEFEDDNGNQINISMYYRQDALMYSKCINDIDSDIEYVEYMFIKNQFNMLK